MVIQCTDIFLFSSQGGYCRKENGGEKKEPLRTWRILTRTPRFGEITLPLKPDYGIEIASLNASSSSELEISSLTPGAAHMPGSAVFFPDSTEMSANGVT